MDFEPQDFTGIHVWYQDKAWMVQGHEVDTKMVILFNPDEGEIRVPESDIAPRI